MLKQAKDMRKDEKDLPHQSNPKTTQGGSFLVGKPKSRPNITFAEGFYDAQNV